MKIGTFVGQEGVSLTDDEIRIISERVKNTIGDGFYIMEYSLKEEKTTSYDGYATYTAKVLFTDKTTRRDSHGNSFIPNYMRITIHKEKGYDENEVGRFYEWEKGFTPEYNHQSFSCTIDLMGYYRGYRRKNVEYIVGITPTNYSYGTELDDLTIENGIYNIKQYIRASTIATTPIKTN